MTMSEIDGVWYYMSSRKMTIAILCENGRIVYSPPIVRRFIGQELVNLVGWMEKQGGFYYTPIDDLKERLS